MDDLMSLIFPDLFQSTLPVGGATLGHLLGRLHPIFQSTLPVGGATTLSVSDLHSGQFQSTLPVGGATLGVGNLALYEVFQSTLPVGGATPGTALPVLHLPDISIHAPRGGSDRGTQTMRLRL